MDVSSKKNRTVSQKSVDKAGAMQTVFQIYQMWEAARLPDYEHSNPTDYEDSIPRFKEANL